MGDQDRTTELVQQGDLDELIRHVDRLGDGGRWSELVHLRAVCRAAAERGRQLWPAADHATYRLALEAPAELAVSGFDDLGARFVPGPLTEVVASTHAWAELAPHLPAGVVARTVAHERAIRGDLPELADWPDDLPLALEPWEPEYPLATYRPDGAEFPSPAVPTLEPVTYGAAARPIDDITVEGALRATVETWASQSNGRVETTSVRGDARAAVATFGVKSGRWAQLTGAGAMAHLAWAAASGGGHGRRRGMAAGRFDAWWAATTLTGYEWPPPVDGLGQGIDELGWYVWSAGEPQTGWRLQLAIEDPHDGLAWAISAHDAAV